MSDLETRKMLAEFAGWKDIRTWVEGDIAGHQPDESGCLVWCGYGKHTNIRWARVPHFESDPAAACSLLPKLAAAALPKGSPMREMHKGTFWVDLGEALVYRPGDVCKFIADAVRKLKEKPDD